jgi:hypothetical protein
VTWAERKLRAERMMMIARYDSEKMPDYMFVVIKAIEREIAWMRHHQEKDCGCLR